MAVCRLLPIGHRRLAPVHSKHFGGIKFGCSEKDRQTAKFKPPPNFPAIRYDATLQVMGSNAQGFANAILFCGFTKQVRRKLWESTVSLCSLSCIRQKWLNSQSDYSTLQGSNEEDKRGSLPVNVTTKSQYGLREDYSESYSYDSQN